MGEFSGCADPVTVAVLPHLKICPQSIVRVDPAVGVVVPRGKRLEAIRGSRDAVSQQRAIAKELPASIDPSIAVAVPDEQAILTSHPARSLREPVAVVVEVATLGCRRRLDAVAVQVEDDRRNDGLGLIEKADYAGQGRLGTRQGAERRERDRRSRAARAKWIA